MLKVIDGHIKKEPDYKLIYLNGFVRSNTQRCDDPSDRDNIKRSIYYLVKYFNCLNAHQITGPETLEGNITLMQAANYLIGTIAPAELMTIFPVAKTYDGERWECKDYFYTMEMIKEHGIDTPIGTGEEVFSFLWDYTNNDIRHYMVQCMNIISRMNEIQTGKSIFEQFIEKEGLEIPLYRQYESQDGNKYIVDENGRSAPLQRAMPRHLKLIH